MRRTISKFGFSCLSGAVGRRPCWVAAALAFCGVGAFSGVAGAQGDAPAAAVTGGETPVAATGGEPAAAVASDDGRIDDSWFVLAVPLESPRAKPLRVNAGFGLLARDLAYNQPVGDSFNHELQPHTRSLMLMGLAMEWYPAAHFPLRSSNEFLTHAGLYASFDFGLAGTTPIGDVAFDTTYVELNLGARVRYPIAGHELGLQLGWGLQSLEVGGDNQEVSIDGIDAIDPGVVPDISYTFIRVGPDARLLLPPFKVSLGGFLRLPTIGDDAGELAEDRWFPDASATGWEATLEVELPLHNALTTFVSADVNYYALSMNSDQEEAIAADGSLNQAVAGGAADVYASFMVGARFVMPGTR